MSLDSLLDSLVQLSDTGDCVARVECLLKDLKAVEEKAQVPSAPHSFIQRSDLKLWKHFYHHLNGLLPPAHDGKGPAARSARGPVDPEQPLRRRLHQTQMC